MPRPTAARRPVAVVALCVVQLIALVFALASLVRFVTSVSPGVLPGEDFTSSGVVAIPVTAEAAAALADVKSFPVIVEVNGRSIAARPAGRRAIVEVLRLLDDRSGATNTIVVEVDGERRRLDLRAALPSPAKVPFFWILLGFHAVGTAFCLVGWLVWWRRPEDPAALPLLLFCFVSSIQMASGFGASELHAHWRLVTESMLPLYGPMALWLTLRFTGHPVGPRLRTLGRYTFVFAAALVLAGMVSIYRASVGEADTAMRVVVALSGVLLTLCVVALAVVCIRMARRSSPPALRQRARFMGVTSVIAFLPPSLLVLVPRDSDLSLVVALVTLGCLGLFPAALGWAIVRHRLFDIRVVLGKGLVFLALSGVVSLGYVALVVGAVRLLGGVAESPAFLGVSLAGSIVVFTLLQIRVQRFVDRRIHASRYLYAGAVEAASESIARAHKVEDAIETARSALMGAMRLSRGWVVFREGDDDSVALRCVPLGAKRADTSNDALSPLPDSFDASRFPPLAEALERRRWVSAYDAQVTSDADARSEAAFFERHGVEAIVPFGATRTAAPARETRDDDGARAPGALLVGPKLDGRPLDDEDLALLYTVANQLAVGIENARALAEIHRLKDGLEALVEERTRDLRKALDDLQTAQGQLVESEKQAMLGRLVAGIVHEINTPLGVVMSSSDTIQRSLRQSAEKLGVTTDAEAIERVRRMLDASAGLAELQATGSRRISEVVASLKELVSLDRAAIQAFDVRAGIDSVVRLVSGSVEGRIAIERVYPESLASVQCQPDRLNQVFLHLLQNAMASIDGDGRIDIVVSATGERVEVVVRDTGRGIAPEMLPGLFEFGFAKKDTRMGLRLGLPMSKQTVTALGGELSVESELGRGTTVRVTLPAMPA